MSQTPKQFRKKPVTIEAMQYLPDTASSIIKWAAESGQTITFHCEPPCSQHMDDHKLRIPTLEGTMFADNGDYIIRGISGEFYPCKPDIFALTYEAVTE